MVERPSRWSGSGRETLPEVWKWSGEPHEGSEVVRTHSQCPEVVESHFRRRGSVRETLPDVRKWTGDPLEGLEVVGRPSRRSKIGRETLFVVS